MSSASTDVFFTTAASAEDGAGELGRKLRQRRVVRGLSLQQVAEKSGVSLAQISQIERNISAPSLRSLQKICAALDMPMGWLFEPAAETRADGNVVVRGDDRRRIEIEGSGMAKELMTPDACPQIQMIRIAIRPGGGWEGPFSGTGRRIDARCGYVVSGRVRIRLDDEEYRLGPGDSFATGPRNILGFWCDGQEDCEVIWVVTPAVY
jgi:transcriptional regulator with XRE-family HTH domain